MKRQAGEWGSLHDGSGRSEELPSQMQARHAEDYMDELIDGATPEQLKLAVQSLMKGLADLGFGADEDINGADAVDAISALYADVANRVLR